MPQNSPAPSQTTPWPVVTHFHFALAAALGLVFLGLLNLWDFRPFQSYIFMYTGHQKPWNAIVFQLAWIVPGIVGFVLLRNRLGWMRKHAWIWAAVPVILLILPFIPGIGVPVGGGVRRSIWVFGILINAGLWAVLAALPTLAVWLSEPATVRARVCRLCWFLAINLLLALQPNLPMLALFNAVTLTVVLVSGTADCWKTAAVLSLFMAAACTLGVATDWRSVEQFRAMSDHRLEGLGAGYQARMSLEDIHSGGLFGQGLGSFAHVDDYRSNHVLPDTVTTFMLQITGRILGLVGIGAVLLLLTILSWSAWKAAANQQDQYARLLCMGALAFFGFQAAFSILRTLNLLPFIPSHAIPFLAYGQTTMAAFMAIALLFPGPRSILPPRNPHHHDNQ